MSPRLAGPQDIAYGRLADHLAALANPARLELLHLLRFPRSAGDIELRPSEDQGLSPDRAMTREAVRKHLAKLEEAGFVTTRRLRREGTYVKENVVNHQMVYAVVEELRRITRVVPTVAPPSAATMTSSPGQAVEEVRGPRVIVVHGAQEGATFPLDAKGLAEGRGWVIGRRAGLPVSLDYDPFVSQEHAEVAPTPGGFELRDLRTNKNGTERNWRTLPRGGAAPLETGDLVGLGRSLLLFRAS